MAADKFALAVALAAAFVGAQAPEFAQQYRQRAGGALEELKRIVARFEADAAQEGLTPAEGVRRLEANGDPLARERGEDMETILARTARLDAQLQAMASAGPLTRIAVMAEDFDPDVARGTLHAFEPAAPLTAEALAAAGLAAALGWTATRLLALPYRRRPPARPAASA